MGESNDKPPIGVKPVWIGASERIKDLSNAIERCSECGMTDKTETGKVREWAIEIVGLCDLMDRLRDLRERRKWAE